MKSPVQPAPSPVTWPELPYADWAPTKKTLQMVAQMVAKVRLALAPPLPEWLHDCLYLDPRGFTTGPIPFGLQALAMRIDVFDAEVWIDVSDGRRARVSLGPNRTVADIWADCRAALGSLEVGVDTGEK